jgi:uncharacterized membrane-anchored protein
MESNYNKSLFWYGVKAKIKGFFGAVLITIGIVTGLILVATVNTAIGLIALIAFCAVGGFLVYQSKSERFDFQRQSGNIIHQGDGRW